MEKSYHNEPVITIDTLEFKVSCKFKDFALTLSSNNIQDILFLMIDKIVDKFLLRPKLVYTGGEIK